MGLFGNSKKAKVVLSTTRAGGALKRTKFTVGANVIVMLLTAIEASMGGEIMPEELKHGVANLIVTGIAMVADYMSYRKSKKTEAAVSAEPIENF